MVITTQYNNDDGLCALVKWYHSSYQRELPPDISDDTFGSCHYSITVINKTSQQTVLFTLDNGNGILLPNLQFSTEYFVAVRSIPSEVIDSSLSHQRNASHVGDTTLLLEQKFLTPRCSEVFGSGSLECAPEPVKSMEAIVSANGSVNIQWIPSTDPNAILVYQLLYRSLTNHYDCNNDPSSIYVNAGSTSATIQLPGRTHCEYSIKLINYDLIGREASTEVIVWYRPDVFNSNLIYIYPIVLLISAVILLKCCMCLCCSNGANNHSVLLSSCNEKGTVTIV
ncbi:unnamed protein product [Litomosoides sigmodontis]|uniref:Fibronectin type-III domain-containing protein n=1 Tax=Litomosoides sigmodontis TaxID=42156 RepID=A0A3P6V2D7_LITSI|nr:unnamed protein product [Litomosoides sigmodontis]